MTWQPTLSHCGRCWVTPMTMGTPLNEDDCDPADGDNGHQLGLDLIRPSIQAMVEKVIRVRWVSFVVQSGCHTTLKFPPATQFWREGGGRLPYLDHHPPPLPIYSRSCFYSVEILSRVVTTRHKQRPAPRHIHVGFFSTSSPAAVFLHYHLWIWDGHAMSRRAPPRRPKNRFPPQQGCPGDPSAPGGGRAQHVSLNRAAHQLRDPKLAFLSQPPHVRPSGPVK